MTRADNRGMDNIVTLIASVIGLFAVIAGITIRLMVVFKILSL